MLRLVTAVRVFAVHDLRLVGMQLKAQGPEPLNKVGPQLLGLLLGVAVDDHIIRVTLERTAGVFAVYPLVERIVHEEVREQRRDRRSLWGSTISRRGGSVCHRHGGFEPVGAHNSVVGADQGFRAPSWDQESVNDAVHEGSASVRIAAGQRPRPSLRHPHPSSSIMSSPNFPQALMAACTSAAPLDPRIASKS